MFGRSSQPLSADNTLRGGDKAEVTGVMTYGFGSYRIHATNAQVSVSAGNPRTASPELSSGNLRVASMNVLNYFNTLNGSNQGCTVGGTSGASRGANNCAEFERQQTKIVSAIEGLDAAVLGVNEIENDYAAGANSSAASLVSALNARAGFEKYAYVNPARNVGSDAISVGLLYQPAKVEQVGRLAVLDSSVDRTYDDTKNRPTWAQTFQSKDNGGRFTIAVAHLKSKGSACATPDKGDGQGDCADVRNAAAGALARWLDSNPTGVAEEDRVVMGDLNSYAMEDSIMTLEQGGYRNLFETSAYSYQFSGQWGSLDHALATPSLAAQVVDKTKWHINADEPIALDYNTEFKSPTQLQNYYAPDAFRSSDHDPVLLGLNLTAQEPVAPVTPVGPGPTDPTPTPPTDPVAPPSGAAGLIISEYVEGSGNNKALELYNAGSAPVNLADYKVLRYSNGKAAADGTITLTGTLNPGGTYVIANLSSVPALLALSQLTSGTLNHNGNDALALTRADGTLVDVFGRIGEDPGSAWRGNGVITLDMTLRRKAGIVSGDPDGSDVFDPSAQWVAASKDDFSGLGQR